jgi:uncharacterized protein (DUF1778 family)
MRPRTMKTNAQQMELPDAKMTDILRARCREDQKSLVRRAARAIGLDEADLIRIGSTRYASEILYRSPALHAAN